MIIEISCDKIMIPENPTEFFKLIVYYESFNRASFKYMDVIEREELKEFRDNIKTILLNINEELDT